MTKWPHLLTEQFQTRYAVAAWLLRDCHHIVEIGGGKTPISQFIDDRKCVFVIDPKVEPATKFLTSHNAVKFQDWNKPDELCNFGLVLLGMDIEGENCRQKLYDLIDESQRTVIGIPVHHDPSVDQLNCILENVKKKITFKIAMDFDVKPFGLRHIYLLEN